MLLHQSDPVSYYTFESFDNEKILHGVFTRQGGVSPAPWDSLNLGSTVGDEKQHVIENRERAFRTIGLHTGSLFDVWQVHSADVVVTDTPRLDHTPHQRADAILTDKTHVTLLMRFADCVPILLYDPKHRVIGIAHAGWQGTVKRIVKESVKILNERYRSKPMDILAGIGPSIGPDHYIIGSDVVSKVRDTFGQDANFLLQERNGTMNFDLWKANQLLLEQAGVKEIEVANSCTACDLNDWYSHRAEGGKTGRFGVIVSLMPKT